MYYNYDGPSIKLNTGYRWSKNVYLPISYEKTFQSTDRKEASVAMDWQMGRLGVFVQALLGDQIVGDPSNPDRSQFASFKEPQYNAELRYLWSRSFSSYSGFRTYNGNTLDGQRFMPSFEKGSAPNYTEACLGFKWQEN
jgi:hypothetical protein